MVNVKMDILNTLKQFPSGIYSSEDFVQNAIKMAVAKNIRPQFVSTYWPFDKKFFIKFPEYKKDLSNIDGNVVVFSKKEKGVIVAWRKEFEIISHRIDTHILWCKNRHDGIMAKLRFS